MCSPKTQNMRKAEKRCLGTRLSIRCAEALEDKPWPQFPQLDREDIGLGEEEISSHLTFNSSLQGSGDTACVNFVSALERCQDPVFSQDFASNPKSLVIFLACGSGFGAHYVINSLVTQREVLQYHR